MSDANVDVVRRIQEAWNNNDLDALDDLIAADFAAHTPGSDTGAPGLQGAKEAHMGGMQAFPDGRDEILDIFGEEDKIVVRTRMTGTNEGGIPWFGVPANGKKVDIEHITIYRLQGGKVVETWAQMELPKMMQQLGMMPEM